MFPFNGESRNLSTSDPTRQTNRAAPAAAHPLDEATGGLFSATTSAQRVQRVSAWLQTNPDAETLQLVYKDLSARDKGAARALRDRLDELRRTRAQEALTARWREKAQGLLDAERLNIADALAWERDAAAEGAPLSREPLAGLRARLAERMRAVEDLQQRVMVQVEAATLLTRRIELLSTRAWNEAADVRPALETDLKDWQERASAIVSDPQWAAVDLRHAPQLESAQKQLQAVWDAFVPALEQAVAAAADARAPLPPVQIWAEQLQKARQRGDDAAAGPARAKEDKNQARRETAAKVVQAGAKLLEHAVAAGNIKDVNSARQALRRTLKAHGQWIDDALEARVHAALVSAGELQGWQRWSADKAREQLVARAEGLLRKRKLHGEHGAAAGASPEFAASEAPAAPLASEPTAATPTPDAAPAGSAPAQPAPAGDEPASVDATPAPADQQDEAAAQRAADTPAAAETPLPGAAAAPAAQDELMPLEAGYAWEPVLTGRKLQDALRKLREEWKTADTGGAPNQALWRRFDRACNTAHGFVVQWLEQVRAEEEKNASDRRALIQQLRDWAAAHPGGAGADWKKVARDLRRFSQRWRDAGHVSEKFYRSLQQQWKEAMTSASAPLEQEQKASRARRQELIAQAQALGAEPDLRIGAIKALQSSWQAEARTVPLNRKREQKLWEAFRKPLDDAFRRKDAERERHQAAVHAHDQAVLTAARILEAANASGDAARIRDAMAALEQATRAQPVATDPGAGGDASVTADPAAPVATDQPAPASVAGTSEPAPGEPAAPEKPESEPTPADQPIRVLAVRGDDRPDAIRPRKARDERPRRDDRRRGDSRRPRDAGPGRDHRGPFIGHSARRAKQQAEENAQQALRQLAARAHGEALVELLSAWRQSDAGQVPDARDFGRAVTPSIRSGWAEAIAGTGTGTPGQAGTALLRLEEAAEAPSPADQVDARRALKLQLLTQRDDPSPAETWPQDVQIVLASGYSTDKSERLQKALKILLHKR